MCNDNCECRRKTAEYVNRAKSQTTDVKTVELTQEFERELKSIYLNYDYAIREDEEMPNADRDEVIQTRDALRDFFRANNIPVPC